MICDTAHPLPTTRGFDDITGRVFSRLTVISYAGRRPNSAWLCLCECGTRVTVLSNKLKTGHTKSCGCLQSDSRYLNVTHGLSGTTEYKIWLQMRARCENKGNTGYQNYGARGIRVCDRWRVSFENFYADMGPRPSPNHSIDRINNDGDYELGNCRWATQKEQSRNTRRNLILTLNEKSQCLMAWSEELGINAHSLCRRIENGWSHERALTTPFAESYSRETERHDTPFRIGDSCPLCGHKMTTTGKSKKGLFYYKYIGCRANRGGCGFKAGSVKVPLAAGYETTEETPQ